MPFTLAHPAAVLPLARSPLVPSALVCGSVAPDVPYYVSLQWLGGDYNLTLTHAATSLLWLDPLIALVLLAAFHLLVKRPLAALLTPAAAARVWPAVEAFTWRGAGLLARIVLSAVVGAATHLAWDGLGEVFGSSWSSRLDLAGSLVGGAVLLGWLVRWWRRAAVRPVPPGALLPPPARFAVRSVVLAAGVLSGAVSTAARLPEVQDSLREQALWSAATVVQHASRIFVVHAGTAVAVAVTVYAAGWHLARWSPGRSRAVR
ncbi:DUF4184 family protein [Blastococcus litoris]|uniref:DUF4184 family protein n=1 Tax=Blastococcus litoris TaxID=2171622 RepID=UPI000E2FFB2D|nr:DUF4184 family protein [Blastococcus litoris]